MSKREEIIKTARSLIGAPYQYGAYLSPESGEEPAAFDCSSFIQYVYKKAGINLPRSSILQAAQGEEVPFSEMKSGDLVFYEGNAGHYNYELFGGQKVYVGHAAIYAGDGKIIHATANEKIGGVTEQNIGDLPNPPYRIVIIKRVLE